MVKWLGALFLSFFESPQNIWKIIFSEYTKNDIPRIYFLLYLSSSIFSLSFSLSHFVTFKILLWFVWPTYVYITNKIRNIIGVIRDTADTVTGGTCRTKSGSIIADMNTYVVRIPRYVQLTVRSLCRVVLSPATRSIFITSNEPPSSFRHTASRPDAAGTVITTIARTTIDVINIDDIARRYSYSLTTGLGARQVYLGHVARERPG